MDSQHKKALSFLEAWNGRYFSPERIKQACMLYITTATLGRKLRYDRECGRLKSRLEIADFSKRKYVVYACKKGKK